jgi:prepilin-type processing-associated H-X9-DG protein
MNPHFLNQRNPAFTRIDAMMVITGLFVLVAVLLPMHMTAKHRAQRINCASNLKFIGLAYNIWAGDHNNQYPMSFSVTNGGGMELIATGNVAAYFDVMSNELSTTLLLTCPAESEKEAYPFGGAWFTLENSNISYFVGLKAGKAHPRALLSGDDNFAIGGVPVKSGLLTFSPDAPISWTPERHQGCGNLLFGDGSVTIPAVDNSRLTNIVHDTHMTNRLMLP